MFLSELRIRNFRQFGQDDKEFFIRFNKGVTALVGQNDSGKSTVIDAIRYVLLTRDQEFIRVQPEDFHIDENGTEAKEIYISCKLSGLTESEKGAFLEYLTYDDDDVSVYVNWTVRSLTGKPSSRRWIDVSINSGIEGVGPSIEPSARALLSTAYLRPLRDAEREMSSGRGSRLSQILSNVPEIGTGDSFDKDNHPKTEEEIRKLGLVGLYDYIKYMIEEHQGIYSTQKTINFNYLSSLMLEDDGLYGRISFSEGGTDEARFRQILERLQLVLYDGPTGSPKGRYGLGSNNILFMA